MKKKQVENQWALRSKVIKKQVNTIDSSQQHKEML